MDMEKIIIADQFSDFKLKKFFVVGFGLVSFLYFNPSETTSMSNNFNYTNLNYNSSLQQFVFFSTENSFLLAKKNLNALGYGNNRIDNYSFIEEVSKEMRYLSDEGVEAFHHSLMDILSKTGKPVKVKRLGKVESDNYGGK